MGQIVPDAVERYLSTLNRLGDPVLEEVARAGEAAELPLIDAEVGGLLRVLATSIGATRILEIGTAIGYSGIWLARALPTGGMLLTIGEIPIGHDSPARTLPAQGSRIVSASSSAMRNGCSRRSPGPST